MLTAAARSRCLEAEAAQHVGSREDLLRARRLGGLRRGGGGKSCQTPSRHPPRHGRWSTTSASSSRCGAMSTSCRLADRWREAFHRPASDDPDGPRSATCNNAVDGPSPAAELHAARAICSRTKDRQRRPRQALPQPHAVEASSTTWRRTQSLQPTWHVAGWSTRWPRGIRMASLAP